MTSDKIRKMSHSRLVWRSAWRNLRQCMRDKAELAWRLRHGFRFAPASEYTVYHNAACDVMYARSMPMPKNRMGK